MVLRLILFFQFIQLLVSSARSEENVCNFRGNNYSGTCWRFFIDHDCYTYTNPYRLQIIYNITKSKYPCGNHIINVMHDENGTIYFFDHTNKTSTDYIRKSFKTEKYYDLWYDCCKQGDKCCSENMVEGDPGDCPAIWDAWSCFPATKPNTNATLPCSNQAYSSGSPDCILESAKECYADGTWNQRTDYNGRCAIAPIYRRKYNVRSKMLMVAIVLSLPAIVIFVGFEKFRNETRIILHRNLIITIVLRYVLTVLTEELILIPEIDGGVHSIYSDNGVWCRILSSLSALTLNAVYCCMLADSFYLHKMLVRTFANEPKIMDIYLATAGSSIIPTLAWTITKAVLGSVNCWLVDDKGEQWINDGFRIAILIINVILLCDIIRVMLMKLKQGSPVKHAKATFRATLFLLPLFGVPILIFANTSMIDNKPCSDYLIFYYASYINEALQGTMVATLFCYLNKEVHDQFRNLVRKITLKLANDYNITLRRTTVVNRRTTTATFVDSRDLQK